ncbi:hypothetical protein BAE44_0025746 [Dichanthelium oligosanthes]|uniref:Uncharacterized protein n=1 Tax=Dichanthelium oligosanthes TaxID=888268 RepID=A0A1E5UKB7_9POAL|nr:hypothetical protein BAE44_0025746 [Dichanthelium oligosanthes]
MPREGIDFKSFSCTQSSRNSKFGPDIPEEPLQQYRRSCALCASYLDILHPMDDREFVCGNGNAKDWTIKKCSGMRFISRRDPADPNSEEEGERRGC